MTQCIVAEILHHKAQKLDIKAELLDFTVKIRMIGFQLPVIDTERQKAGEALWWQVLSFSQGNRPAIAAMTRNAISDLKSR